MVRWRILQGAGQDRRSMAHGTFFFAPLEHRPAGLDGPPGSWTADPGRLIHSHPVLVTGRRISATDHFADGWAGIFRTPLILMVEEVFFSFWSIS